jgi:UDP-N-acetylglucosamine--dolichyl-phosphate N-acetylglucosaminephosphotransferase
LPVVCGFIGGVLVYVAFKVFIYEELSIIAPLFAALTAILVATIIGLVDDILGWKIGLRQFQKAALTIAIAVPIMVINAGSSVMNVPFMGSFDFGLFYPLLLIPIGIIATSNAFNMLAGYNGLEAGMGIIVLTTLSIISLLQGAYWVSVLGMCMVAALVAFLFYNWHPAKLFPGDTLTYSVGTLIGIMAIFANMEKFAVMCFSLYIVQFFLKLRGKFQEESFATHTSHGLQAKNIFGIEHFTIRLLQVTKGKATEVQVVICILLVQILISAATLWYYVCC